MKKIKVHTKEIDSHRHVIGIDLDNNVSMMQYGELGYPLSLIHISEPTRPY